jgi:hypothetical protein
MEELGLIPFALPTETVYLLLPKPYPPLSHTFRHVDSTLWIFFGPPLLFSPSFFWASPPPYSPSISYIVYEQAAFHYCNTSVSFFDFCVLFRHTHGVHTIYIPPFFSKTPVSRYLVLQLWANLFCYQRGVHRGRKLGFFVLLVVGLLKEVLGTEVVNRSTRGKRCS